METWRTVPSLPEYEASDLGRIRRKTFVGKMPYGGARTYGGKPWIGAWGGTRYIFRYRGKTYKIARLICEAFHGSPPTDKPYCIHLDENSRNNLPNNLAWGSAKENLNAPGFIAYCRSRTGAANPYIKGRIKKGLH